MRILLAMGLATAGAQSALALELQPFRTPSNNIHCLFIEEGGAMSVECELRTRDNHEPVRPMPTDCELDWGSRFAMAVAGEAVLLCHGDTLVTPDSSVLAYAETFERGGISCLSEMTGLICRNGEGHGFRLHRATQELF